MEPTPTTVEGVRDVGPDTVALDLSTPAGFDAQPGQFVKLTLDVDGKSESRFYTLSSPEVAETFEVTVGIDPDGDLGPRLASLEPGEEIEVAGPFGSAHYEGESSITVLAGGPGVGPAVGVAERALHDGGAASVVYRDDDPAHRERLDALRESGAFVAVLDPETDLSDAVADALETTPDAQAFVYGFADFLDVATEALAAAGGDPDDAKVENFG
ncbi:FAD-dependent oxidoreductase [Halococcus hamelinensis]|uniref:Oxidoreductase FAD-binding domain protein n=2 Tax=Halococcus hamelinensis TaxID=332168 RepID=M0MB27_9EURY|nr:FAD-dependent oxidoreductase [Halococcus hamelinensis]EMA41595.1 Oxidoreductase FAD-binding domain protein [Halococcus hamelinensis 100A6]